MSVVQDLFKRVLPSSWAASMESESRRWMFKCQCGHERSVWELGGVRWKAKGNKKQYAKCPSCGERSWHTVYFKQDGEEGR